MTVAERSVIAMRVCKNEESTKLYLVIPCWGRSAMTSATPMRCSPNTPPTSERTKAIGLISRSFATMNP